jgi:hypothetical protein
MNTVANIQMIDYDNFDNTQALQPSIPQLVAGEMMSTNCHGGIFCSQKKYVPPNP